MMVSPSSVCSTTLWVGQVDKKATQQDLTNLFEEFGQIESINVSRSPLFLSLFLVFVSFSAASIKLEINFGFYWLDIWIFLFSGCETFDVRLDW